MSNFVKVKDDFKNLEPHERQWVLVALLYDESINFTEISEAYTKALEKQRQDHWQDINRLGMRLSAAWDYIPREKYFTKAAAAFALLKSGVFHTAPVENEYAAYLAENAYDETDEGFPKTKLKDKATRGRKGGVDE